MSHPDEHVLVYEPNQAARGTELLLWQHADKARLQAFVRALAAGAQLAENTAWAVIVGASTVAGAEGVNLDRWGVLIGEFRGGLTREEYALFLALRIRVNTEHPGDRAMLEVLIAAVAPSTVRSWLVADGIVYYVSSGAAFLRGALAAHAGALIRDFRPAAIYAAVVEYVDDRAAFSWESSATKPVIPAIGSIADPGTAVIGRLIYSGR